VRKTSSFVMARRRITVLTRTTAPLRTERLPASAWCRWSHYCAHADSRFARRPQHFTCAQA